MATVAAMQATDERGRSPTPDYEEFQDIPEVPEEYEDIPVFSHEKTPEPAEEPAGSATPAAVAPQSADVDASRKTCGAISSPPAKEVRDENFNVNRDEPDFCDPDGPECMHSSVGVKALREKLNKMAGDSPKRNCTPSKVQGAKTPVATREVRTHEKPTAPRTSVHATKDDQTKDDQPQCAVEGADEPTFPTTPIQQNFEKLVAQETDPASADAIRGLQMSSEHCSLEEGEDGKSTSGEENQGALDLQGEVCLQVCDSPEAPAAIDGEDREHEEFSQYQDGAVDAAPAQSLSTVVKVISEGSFDSQALTPNDHARATIAAMKAKCTARMPAPPPKAQTCDEHTEVEYSNEEIEALADVLLNPMKKKIAESQRTTTPSKINGHLREALTEIHYSPSARASVMLQKLRQKELFCRKVPTPKAPKGSVLGLQPGRSLMPVKGLQAANMAALATVTASMSPHLKNNTQHSRRSKMPNMGHEAADRAALAEVKSAQIRKLALFTQPELSIEEQEMQKAKWAEYVGKYGNKAKERFEESCKDEDIPAPIFVPVDDSMDMHHGPVMIEGLQDSIDGLQASFSSEDGEGDHSMQVLENDESVEAVQALQQDDLSDDEICPELASQNLTDYAVPEKVEKIHKTQGQVQEIGRKVMVLGQRVGQDRKESQQSGKQLMGDAFTMLQVEELSKVQKILDLFDVITQTVCDSEEHKADDLEGNKLMAEIVTLRAAQLALIQDDYDYAIDSVEDVKNTFSAQGYTRCNGLLDQAAKLIFAEKSAHVAREANLEQAIQTLTKEEVQRFHGTRGGAILQYARAALANSRFDHALAFIVKSKRAFCASDQLEMLNELEDLNRSVVMEATRMASDSLILEATRLSSSSTQASVNSTVAGTQARQLPTRSAVSDATESTIASEAPTEASHFAQIVREEDRLESIFAPSDATSKLIARIEDGGRVALKQDHDEIEEDIQRLRAGLEATRTHLNDEIVPLHRKSYAGDCRAPGTTPSSVSSVTATSMSPHAKRAQQQQKQSCTNSTSQSVASDELSLDTLLGSGYAPLDRELEQVPPISARRESRQALDSFTDIDPALLKATSPYTGGMVGCAMVLPTIAANREWET